MAFNVKHLSICCFPSVYFFDEMSVRNFCPFLNRSLFSFFWPCCVFLATQRLSLVVTSGGYSLVAVLGLLSLWSVGFMAQGLSSCGNGPDCPTVWETLVPGPGIKPVCPALQGGFLTPGPSREVPFSLVEF